MSSPASGWRFSMLEMITALMFAVYSGLMISKCLCIGVLMIVRPEEPPDDIITGGYCPE